MNSKTDQPARLLHPVDEARAILGGISRTAFYALVKDGTIKTRKLGKRTFVSDDEIRRVANAEAA